MLVPPGCTSLEQPIDVVFNKPFKSAVEKLATEHMRDNLNDYLTGKLTAGQRRVLFTKWIGQAWEETAGNKEMVIRSFKKFGISVAIDGSEDDEINITGLEDYRVGDEEDQENDPFADLHNDSD